MTFAGRAWDDTRLLEIASKVERASLRQPPSRTPALAPIAPTVASVGAEATQQSVGSLGLKVTTSYGKDSRIQYMVIGTAPSSIASVAVTINGVPADTVILDGSGFTATGSIVAQELTRQHSQWRVPYGTMIVATVTGSFGELGSYEIVGGR
jgi:amidase